LRKSGTPKLDARGLQAAANANIVPMTITLPMIFAFIFFPPLKKIVEQSV
jgi:hypothetical protein